MARPLVEIAEKLPRVSLATDVLRGLAVRSLTGGKIKGGVEAVGGDEAGSLAARRRKKTQK